jgi:2-polyprenyl-6-methoxyphenol hydroxylase-like FAD-dependent oxidoreductase
MGVSFIILERRKEIRDAKWVIGIQPHILDLFQRLSLADRLMPRGVKVSRGKVYGGRRLFGEVALESPGSSLNCSLYVPRVDMERVMEEHLGAVAPGSIIRQSCVEELAQKEGKVLLRGLLRIPGVNELSAAFLVGTDGPNSAVRVRGGFTLKDAPPDDHFLMGDCSGSTGADDEAAVYLDNEGFMESYPLPGGGRRWVVQTESLMVHPEEQDLVLAIRRRAGVDVTNLTSPVAAFEVHRYAAETFARGRMLLAGDSAHSMSPIGGHGLNTGLMDALDLAGAMNHAIKNRAPADEEFRNYDVKAKSRAHRSVRRAELFLDIGRRGRLSFVKRAGLRLGLNPPGRNLAEEYFTPWKT